MEFKRKSGEVVQLKELKTSQRLQCQEATSIEPNDGHPIVHGLARANRMAAMAALGLTSIDEFDDLDYTYEEIVEIGQLAIEGDKKAADPTSKD